MTLDTLQAIAEKSRAHYDAVAHNSTPRAEEVAAWRKQAFDYHAWLIGREYGLNAAMLYKLSDGKIDPFYP